MKVEADGLVESLVESFIRGKAEEWLGVEVVGEVSVLVETLVEVLVEVLIKEEAASEFVVGTNVWVEIWSRSTMFLAFSWILFNNQEKSIDGLQMLVWRLRGIAHLKFYDAFCPSEQ